MHDSAVLYSVQPAAVFRARLRLRLTYLPSFLSGNPPGAERSYEKSMGKGNPFRRISKSKFVGRDRYIKGTEYEAIYQESDTVIRVRPGRLMFWDFSGAR